MDICVLNQFFYPYNGGTEKVLFEVYRRMAKRHNITVITSAPLHSKKNIVEEIEGITVLRLRSTHIDIPVSPLPFVAMPGLNSAIKKARCELYHINNRYQYFGDNVAAIRKVNGKIALTIHNSLPIGIDPAIDSLGLVYDITWGRILMHEADLLTGVSRNTINTTVPIKDISKAHLVYNGVDHNIFRPIDRDDAGVKAVARSLGDECGSNDANIITNGRLIDQKGQIYLMRAVANLANEGLKLGLLTIGKGPLEKKLVSEAESLGLRDRFWIRNGIAEEKLPDYYNFCDMFALPSLYEPAGLVVLEALACELPSIASSVGGIPEMLDGYGLYAQPKSVEELEDRIGYVLKNRKKMAAMAKRGRKFVVERHDWDKIVKRYEKLFMDTLHY